MTNRSFLSALAAIALSVHAGAQLIGPIPPKPAAPSSAETSPLTPGPEVLPPSGEPRAPSIVERTDSGRLKPLDSSPEDAAIAKYPFDEARHAKIAASQMARRTDTDRFVVANLERVLEVQRLAPQARSANDFDSLFKARDAVAALRMEKPLDRLLRDGAISLEQKVRLEEALREYDLARKKQIDADAKGDPTREAVLNLRQTFDDASREPLASLDRQLSDLADHAEKTLDALTLRDEQRKATDALRFALKSGASNGANAKDMRRGLVKTYWLDVLDMEQKRQALIAAKPGESPKLP